MPKIPSARNCRKQLCIPAWKTDADNSQMMKCRKQILRSYIKIIIANLQTLKKALMTV